MNAEITARMAGATLEVQSDGRRAYHRDGFWVSVGPVLNYTTSLDDALTLVPDGWEWALYCELGKYRVEMGDPMRNLPAEAATPALALCIASIQARSHVGAG